MVEFAMASTSQLQNVARFTIETDAIQDNGFFDPRYTCDIDNSSPHLRWSNPPEGTVGYALLAEDLDHPKQISHWVIFNIPVVVEHLPAGIPPQEALPNGIRQGLNGWGKLGYTIHRYRLRLLALRALPEIRQRLNREELLQAIEPFIIETATIEGRYQRMMQIAG
jgi:Raf kinase inhibitor-like YbhB/YbcL family protein